MDKTDNYTVDLYLDEKRQRNDEAFSKRDEIAKQAVDFVGNDPWREAGVHVLSHHKKGGMTVADVEVEFNPVEDRIIVRDNLSKAERGRLYKSKGGAKKRVRELLLRAPARADRPRWSQ